MSVSHIIDPANTDLQDVYCENLDVAGDVVVSGGFEIDGLLETKGGIAASGTATLPAISATSGAIIGLVSTTATAQPAAQFTGNNSASILNVTQSGAGNALVVSGTTTSTGLTIGPNGITSIGGITMGPPPVGNSVITIDCPVAQSSAVNFLVNGTLSGSIAADAGGLTINGALNDPTFDITLAVAGANKIMANSSYSYTNEVYNNAPAPGSSPLVANTRVAVLRYEGISSVAAGAEQALTWTNSLATVGSIVSVKVLFTNAATNSWLVYKGCVPSAGSIELIFGNGGSAATGAATSLTILAELLF